MKKFIFSFFIFSLMVVSAEAQKSNCSKPCTSKSASAAGCQAKAPSVAMAGDSETSAYAAKVAAMDQTIETRTDPATGNVSYVRKETCGHSGSVAYVNVNFDPATSTFVNASPAAMEGAHNCGSKATTASGKSGCATGAASGKACCAHKGAAVKSGEKVKS